MGAESIFLAESVALVGASDSNEGFAPALFENLRDHFGGRVWLINPRRSTVFGEPCYPDFAHIGQPVDLALVAIPGAAVPGVLEEGAANGLRAALLYNETLDHAGIERVQRTCAASGLRVAGPNSLGALSIARGGTFYPMRSMAALPAGNVGIISASGGALQHWMLQGAARGLGFTYAISTGNEIDLGLADYLAFMAADDTTRVICVIAEGIRAPQAFARAAATALARHKPIVFLKVGRSEAARRAAVTHTGALAGDDDVFNAVCVRYAMCRVPSLDDLLEVALAFSRERIPARNGIAMLCHSGGIKGLFLDAAETAGLRLATLDPSTEQQLRELGDFPVDNPLDGGMRLALHADEYGRVARALAGDPNVDILAIQGRLPGSEAYSPHKLDAYNELFAAIEIPVLAFERMAHNVDGRTAAAAAIPFLHGIPATVGAIGALVRYGHRLRAQTREPAAIEADVPAAEAFPADAAEFVRAELTRNCVTFPLEVLVRDRARAAAAVRHLTFPLVVKIASTELHKTELGGVRTGIRTPTELAAAIAEIGAPEVLVQEFFEGVEIIAGAREDEQFGPIILVGLGGTAAQALRDTAIRLLPIGRDDVFDMLTALRGNALLGPFRGRPVRDIEALVAAVVGLGRTFMACRPWLAELEINPLIVGAQGAGARAVDVRFTGKVAP